MDLSQGAASRQAYPDRRRRRPGQRNPHPIFRREATASRRRRFLYDTFDVGKYVVAPFLWKERISRIDTIVLTHPHPDHLQGLLFILENFNVSEV